MYEPHDPPDHGLGRHAWCLVEFTPEAAEAHDRRVYNVSPEVGLGWRPYQFRLTYRGGANTAWSPEANTTWSPDEDCARRLRVKRLEVVGWTQWSDGMRWTYLREVTTEVEAPVAQTRHIDEYAVTTTAGQVFSGEKSARMAYLIWERWGFDTPAAACAWRRLHQNSCPDEDFVQLAGFGRFGPEVKR